MTGGLLLLIWKKKILYLRILLLAVHGCIDTPPVISHYSNSGGSESIFTRPIGWNPFWPPSFVAGQYLEITKYKGGWPLLYSSAFYFLDAVSPTKSLYPMYGSCFMFMGISSISCWKRPWSAWQMVITIEKSEIQGPTQLYSFLCLYAFCVTLKQLLDKAAKHPLLNRFPKCKATLW